MLARAWIAVVAVVALHAAHPALSAPSGPPQGQGTYDQFVALFEEFVVARLPSAWNANFNDPASPNHGLMDYGAPAMADRLARLDELRSRLEDMNVASWPRERQSEYLAVRALFDQQEFLLRVSRPWARDPGFYVDQLQRFAFTALPAEGDALARLKAELAAVPDIVAGRGRSSMVSRLV